MNYPTAKQYIYLTNTGAHFVTLSSDNDSDRSALQVLLKHSHTLSLHEYLVALKADLSGSAFQYIISLSSKGYITAKNHPTGLEEKPLEFSLPKLLKQLSDIQHCSISDQGGFLISYSGFNLNQAEQAAVLATEIAELQKKRQRCIEEFSGTDISFISMISENEKLETRFLPIYFNKQVFVLSIQGQPILTENTFSQLVWLLSQRYL